LRRRFRQARIFNDVCLKKAKAAETARHQCDTFAGSAKDDMCLDQAEARFAKPQAAAHRGDSTPHISTHSPQEVLP
jgi:hypothetical protein